MTPRKTILPVFIPHEGCTHDCVFCDQHRISGYAASSEGNAANKETIENRISNLIAAWKAEAGEGYNKPAEIAFYGGSFTALPEQRQTDLLEAARPLLELNPLNSIRISTRPDCIDETIIADLKAFGVRTVELGAQSMSDDVLIASKRGHSAKDVIRASTMLKMAEFSLVLQIMTGLPCDTFDKSVYSAKQIIGLKPDAVRVYPTVIVMGTKLHEMWLNGEYAEHSLDDAVSLCSVLYLMFENAGIPVIRMGLNPSEALSGGDAVAGAYHPAFGGLVYSKVYFDEAAELLNGIEPRADVTIAVAKGRTSLISGNRNSNIDALKVRFGLRSLKIIETELVPGERIRIWRSE